MQAPWLIQRLEIQRRGPDRHWEVGWDYMGAAEFEFGAPRDSLKRIFSDELCEHMTTVTCEDKEIMVFMLAKFGFDFKSYQPYLQKLADGELGLKERTHFDERVRVSAGKPPGMFANERTNGWLDLDNDVLWTLTHEHHGVLLEYLKQVKAEWAKRAQACVPVVADKKSRRRRKKKK